MGTLNQLLHHPDQAARALADDPRRLASVFTMSAAGIGTFALTPDVLGFPSPLAFTLGCVGAVALLLPSWHQASRMADGQARWAQQIAEATVFLARFAAILLLFNPFLWTGTNSGWPIAPLVWGSVVSAWLYAGIDLPTAQKMGRTVWTAALGFALLVASMAAQDLQRVIP